MRGRTCSVRGHFIFDLTSHYSGPLVRFPQRRRVTGAGGEVTISMRFATVAAVTFLCAFAHMFGPSQAVAAAPPNREDPCSRAGRDVCGTLGVGYHKSYRYGVRWFGDFRGAVPGEARAFCIDLGFWYASRAYRYRQSTSAGLRNRDGELVPVASRQKLAYAVWGYGRSAIPNQQAAVMLYVHALMGDARPGELDPRALNAAVVSLYRRIGRNAARYHGPYRIETHLARVLAVGRPAVARIRVLSARGFALPHARLTVTARGADGIPQLVQADGAGVARIRFTANAAVLRLSVAAEGLASPLPSVFRATTAAAAANAQRLVVPTSRRVAMTVLRRLRPALTTRVSSEIVRPGSPIFDLITVRGTAQPGESVEVRLFGPFGSRSEVVCARRPYWRGRITVDGHGQLRSPAVTLARAGFYTYRERLVSSGMTRESTTACGRASATALAAPRIVAGGGDRVADARAAGAAVAAPTRVRLATAGVDAPVAPARIDPAHGVLALPAKVGRAGWWRDGMAPGARSGAILIAGHVDSAQAGPGAFFKLHRAKPGDRVEVGTAGGSTFVYRVTSLRTFLKRALPTSIYSSTGRPRLVLVTCGGPFDRASGHYRDNIVVTAVPA
jgi:Sortase domain